MTDQQAIQWALNALFGVVMFLVGWILNNMSNSIERLDADVRAMPEKYVAKTDYIDALHEIRNMLTRIEDKLDGKADR